MVLVAWWATMEATMIPTRMPTRMIALLIRNALVRARVVNSRRATRAMVGAVLLMR